MSTMKELEQVLPPKLYEKAKEELGRFKLTDAQKKKSIEKIIELYRKSRFEPGEAFGMVAAQSISEPATQMTMRTYHVAGAAAIQVTRGLPRMVEIFDARRVPVTPAMTIYLKKAYNTSEKALKIASEIREIKLKDIIEMATIDILNQEIEAIFDEKMLKENSVKPNAIQTALKEGLKGVNVRLKANSVVIKPKEEMSVKELQKIKAKAIDTRVKGLKGISHVVITNKEGDWVLTTLGSNLAKVLDTEGVEPTNTTTNNIQEIYKVFGIEAARMMIITEAMDTLENQGLDVDVRHIMLVADVMTSDGTIRAIGRYGIAGAKGSVLARANFEETIKHLTRAAITNESDNLESIVENVMINQVVPAGTGMFDLIYKPKEKK